MTQDHDNRIDDSPGAPSAGAEPPGTTPSQPGGGDDGEPDAPVSRRRWVLAAIAALGVAIFAVPLLHGPDHPEQATTVTGPGTCEAEGKANLDFTLADVDGGQVRLSDYKGQVILLNFWATWCGPCKVEIPDFVDVYTRYRDKGVVILGVLSLDDAPADQLKAFTTEYKMNYPVLRGDDDFSDANGPVWGLPTTLVIDRQGSICARHMGLVPKETVEREIEGLL